MNYLSSFDYPTSVVSFGALTHINLPNTFLYGILGALLFRSSKLGPEIAAELQLYGVNLPDCGYRVVLFSLEDDALPHWQTAPTHQRRIGLYDTIRTRLLAGMPESTSGFWALQLGWLLGLVYLPEKQDRALTAVCTQAVAYAQALGYPVHVTIGSRLNTLEQVQSAYASASNFEDSRSFFQDPADRIYCVSDDISLRLVDPVQRTEFEAGFNHTAERICGAIQATDVAAASGHMQKQLLQIAQNCKGMPWPTAFNMTLNRFISQLQYRLVEQELADWRYLTARDFSRDLVAAGTMEAYLESGNEMITQLVQHYQHRSADRHTALMRDIRIFIEHNATDMNMGLTSVSREFHMKPREAAESFRKEFGESINDALHRARVKKAKELLLTTDIPVQDIATQVGYCSLATMYRAFTNLEGIAPGKLRQGT